jgi:hypothetical protein
MMGIKKENIQIPFQGQVLKPVIQDYHLGFESIQGESSRNPSLFPHNDRNSFKLLGQQVGFIARLDSIQEGLFSIGNHPIRPIVFSPVAPGKNRWAVSFVPDHLRQKNDEGGLARSTQGDIPHADHFAGEGMGLINPYSIKKSTDPDHPAVKEGQEGKRRKQDFLKLIFFGIADEAMQEAFQFGP